MTLCWFCGGRQSRASRVVPTARVVGSCRFAAGARVAMRLPCRRMRGLMRECRHGSDPIRCQPGGRRGCAGGRRLRRRSAAAPEVGGCAGGRRLRRRPAGYSRGCPAAHDQGERRAGLRSRSPAAAMPKGVPPGRRRQVINVLTITPATEDELMHNGLQESRVVGAPAARDDAWATAISI